MLRKNQKKICGKAHEGKKSDFTSTVAGNTTDYTSSSDLHILAFDACDRNPTDCFLWTSQTVDISLKELTAIHPKALIATAIPTVNPTLGTATSSVLYARTKIRLQSITRAFPCLERDQFNFSNPPYEIRSAEHGVGMFATRPLDIGDLIYMEMPLIVVPKPADLSGVTCPDFDHEQKTACHERALFAMLKVAFGKMKKDDQEAYLGLSKGYREEEEDADLLEILNVFKTNGFEISGLGLDWGCQGDRYAAVGKLLSKVNHSCQPNCAHTFSPDWFTTELRATRAIARGEEILYSYCDTCVPTGKHQEFLNYNHGFSCSCLSCTPRSKSDANDTIRCSIPSRVDALTTLRTNTVTQFPSSPYNGLNYTAVRTLYDTATSIMRDMEKEGLEGYGLYLDAAGVRMEACAMLAHITRERGDFVGWIRWMEEEKRSWEKGMKCGLAAVGSYAVRRRRVDRQA